jgi:hypothetical protein
MGENLKILFHSLLSGTVVGFSSPIGYNFSCNVESDRPNALLDAPWGILIFYDEVWFLTRHLCPYNLQNLPYVRFVDKEYDLAALDLPTYDDYAKVRDSIPQPTRAEARRALDASLRANARPGWRIDTGGPVVKIGSKVFHSTPHPANLLVDDHVASILGLDLITNGQTSLYAKQCVAANLAHLLTQCVMAEALPNFQALDGPYHPVLDDLRSLRSIKAFRRKAEELVAGREVADLAELRADLESDFRDFTAQVIQKKVGRWNLFLSVADLVIGNVPILSSVWDNLKGLHALADAIRAGRTHGWAAFVAKARALKSPSTAPLEPLPSQPEFCGNRDQLSVLRNFIEHHDIWGWNEWIGRKQPQGIPLNPDPDEEMPDPGPVDLAGINLSGMDLYGINMGNAQLEGANFSSAELTFSNFDFAHLEGADFRGATLRGANLTNANLTGADLRGTDLSDTTLAGALLLDSRLDDAALPPNLKMGEDGRVPFWTFE